MGRRSTHEHVRDAARPGAPRGCFAKLASTLAENCVLAWTRTCPHAPPSKLSWASGLAKGEAVRLAFLMSCETQHVVRTRGFGIDPGCSSAVQCTRDVEGTPQDAVPYERDPEKQKQPRQRETAMTGWSGIYGIWGRVRVKRVVWCLLRLPLRPGIRRLRSYCWLHVRNHQASSLSLHE